MKNLGKLVKSAAIAYVAYKVIDSFVENRRANKEKEEVILNSVDVEVKEAKKEKIEKAIKIAGGAAVAALIIRANNTNKDIMFLKDGIAAMGIDNMELQKRISTNPEEIDMLDRSIKHVYGLISNKEIKKIYKNYIEEA